MDVESNRVEYKSRLNEKLERSVVAFLNYHEGGVIYIGVDNGGNAVGVDDVDNVQLKITITSYGGLVDGMTQEDFFSCYSKPRNRELM